MLPVPFVPPKARILYAKFWKHHPFALLLHPLPGLPCCAIPGSIVHKAWVDLFSARPEQQYGYAQLYVLQKCWPHSHTLWIGKINSTGEITLVRASKALSCHLVKLQMGSLEGHLDVWSKILKVKVTFLSLFFCTSLPILSPWYTKENLSLPHLSLKQLGIKRISWKYHKYDPRKHFRPLSRERKAPSVGIMEHLCKVSSHWWVSKHQNNSKRASSKIPGLQSVPSPHILKINQLPWQLLSNQNIPIYRKWLKTFESDGVWSPSRGCHSTRHKGCFIQKPWRAPGLRGRDSRSWHQCTVNRHPTKNVFPLTLVRPMSSSSIHSLDNIKHLLCVEQGTEVKWWIMLCSCGHQGNFDEEVDKKAENGNPVWFK